MEQLVFEPVLPLRWLAAGWALLGGLVVAYVLWRAPQAGAAKRAALALGHAAAPAFLLALLHGPTWVSVKPQDGRQPPFLALIDRSASMASEGAPGAGGTRHAQAVGIVRRRLVDWERAFTVKVVSFDREVRAGGLESGAAPDGAMTDLARAIDEGISSGTPPAAMLLLSDGIHNAAEADPVEAARRARAVGCPIYTVTLGSDAAVRDLGLQLAQAEGLTFVRQPYRALATLSHRGFENTEVKVLVRQGKTVVGETRVPVRSKEDVSLNFDLVQEKPGLYEYTLEVEEHPGEVFRSNNRQRITLRVVDERIRVLVLEGKPYWDSKFLIQALRRDSNVNVSHIVQVTDARSVFDASSKELAPRDLRRPLEDASFLSALQVVILGRDVEPFLTPGSVANLKEWVSRRGGHLVAARGRPVGPRASQEALLSLLPVAWAPDEERRFRLDLTERGRMLSLFGATRKDAKPAAEEDPRVLLRELPSLVTASRVEQERALSVVLARGQGDGPVAEMAVLTFQPYGAGRVVVLEGQALWRWAFQPPDAPAVTRNVFEGFWANLVRWLAGSNDFLPSQQAAVRSGKPAYVLDERPVLYVLRRPPAPGAPEPPAPVLEIRREEGDLPGDTFKSPLLLSPQPVPGDPGLRRAVLDPLPEGRYRAKIQGQADAPEAAFDVVAPLQERLDLRARPETMKRIALASDGEAVPADGVDRLQEAYFRYVARFRPDLEVRTPAWDHAGFWLLLMGWLAGLWYVRRRWGMI